MPCYKILPNRVWRTYRGGRLLDALSLKANAVDDHFPEDWIGSTVRAVNVGREELVEGYTKVQDSQGNTSLLADILSTNPAEMLGTEHVREFGSQLGFLVKFLDAGIRLHIQAHPDRAFSRLHLQSNAGKAEGYYILATREEEPDPCVYLGFKQPVTRERLQQLVEDQNIDSMLELLHKITVRPGDCFFVPGGFPHAIGAGVFMIEIMEASDFVVRLEFERATYLLPESARFMGRDSGFAMDMLDFTVLDEATLRQRCFPMAVPVKDKIGDYSLLDKRLTDRFSLRLVEIDAAYRLCEQSCSFVIVVQGSVQLSIMADHISFVASTLDKFFVSAGTTVCITAGSRGSARIALVGPPAGSV